MKEKKKLSLAAQIFIALVLAVIVGLLMTSHGEFAESYIKPFGTIFLNLIKFIVVPVVLFSIMSGIISMQDIRKVGSIGIKTIVYDCDKYADTPSVIASKRMLDAAGVRYYKYNRTGREISFSV